MNDKRIKKQQSYHFRITDDKTLLCKPDGELHFLYFLTVSHSAQIRRPVDGPLSSPYLSKMHLVTAAEVSKSCNAPVSSGDQISEDKKNRVFHASELFLHLVLTARPSRPIEGSSLTLTCETLLLRQPPPVQPQFSFFREGHNLGSEWSSSPRLQIPTVWKEDSGTYWCTMMTAGNNPPKQSQSSYIQVQRIPVSDVSLETQPPGGRVMKGDKLVLICSVAKGTGNIAFVWYKGHLGLNLENKTQHLRTANFEVAPVTESDSDQYYCAADNGYGPSLSGLVDITVRIPVSCPVLTLRAPRVQAEVGDVVELHCEALGGSPQDVTLGNSSAPSGGGASLNLSLTAEHSGNYSCEADNGQGALRSEAVTLNFTVPAEPRSEHLTSGVVEGLLSSVGLITVVLLFCYWLKRKIVNVMHGDDVYSLVYHVQQEQESGPAEHMRTQVENKVSADIYSRLRKADIADVDYDDTM
ncbi:Fc receptor-like protein 1 [Callospermophilus lateralis]|uniref:Fc receptor-like protein 1 n=1 Tax=Callospermophilus lateralis TaxID=76772 RepID=UPI0040548B73